MQTGTVAANGIELCYESRGPEDGPAVVFIMGLSAQMVFWPERLLTAMAEAGYRVIRFDNRDVGLSTKFREPIKHKPMVAMARHFAGLPVSAPYNLDDLVGDTMGLLDALRIDQAHLVGASMGGMVGQLAAASHPQRVLSLTSIMSSTNSPWLPPPSPAALKTLVAPGVKINDEDDFIRFGLNMMATLGGTLPQDTDELTAMYRQSWARGLNPRGVRNQFMAVMATGNFTRRLRTVRCPTTVIHGSADKLVRPAGGKASAKAIANAKLAMIDGMGHDFPPAAQGEVAGLILDTVRRAAN